ncbi:heat shock protein Hsp20 [Beutenbergia cavernae DSM 12333]|uniref:Heat shock protein Hsp20 n=1 Tax=Beutenbergia cavernae (strain ATCC BAA-8 / DSM 12333 / CCUG 43141 / JCM 11478 / NBRC 16432 / NCIMB 13614 / HKI 0122) TaxID=471853 RepID=C5C3S2_BEUC1|nr:Hsp20/alpha crystallin family protein [Beutenbergia cavernae]ACQ81981.1 heat shock protein Hsp20 [Beutenbergia cavernae DSM 12333]
MTTLPTRTVWTRRDPFTEFDGLIARSFGPGALRPSGSPAGYRPAAETYREGADAVVRLELPGVDAEQDVTVEVTNGRLVVRGERRDVRGAEGRTVREFRYGTFERSFRLPASVSADDVSASYDAGVLSVRVAGAYAGTEPRQIAVTTGATGAPVVDAVEAEPAGAAEAGSADAVEAEESTQG